MRGLAALLATGAVWAGFKLPWPHIAMPAPRFLGLTPRVAGRSIGAGAIGFLVGASVSGNVVLAAATAGLALFGPIGVAHTRRTIANGRERAHWPDWVAALRGQLAAGDDLASATVAAGERIGGLQGRISSEVERGMRNGAAFTEALEDIRNREADALIDRITLTLGAASVSGGPRVAGVLSALGESVADEIRLREAHDAAMTQQRLTALVALVAPWALLLLTVATNPAAEAAYRTRTGTLIILIGGAATLAGYWFARRSARLSNPPRVFS